MIITNYLILQYDSYILLYSNQSYEKQSFHSGTPPPFNLAASQTAGATSAQFGGQHLYIPTIPAPHHMHQQMHQVNYYDDI
jgi:hypothetical protein